MRAALVLVLIGCGGPAARPESPNPPPTSSMLDCSKVGDHVATVVARDKPRPNITPAAITELVTTRCEGDGWSDDTRHCLFAIATVAEGRDCASKMTEEQRTAIMAAARELRKAAGGAGETDDHEADWIRHVVQDQPDDVPR